MKCEYKELMENRPANQATDVDELRESTQIITGVVDEEDDHLLYVLEGEGDGWTVDVTTHLFEPLKA